MQKKYNCDFILVVLFQFKLFTYQLILWKTTSRALQKSICRKQCVVFLHCFSPIVLKKIIILIIIMLLKLWKRLGFTNQLYEIQTYIIWMEAQSAIVIIILCNTEKLDFSVACSCSKNGQKIFSSTDKANCDKRRLFCCTVVYSLFIFLCTKGK